MILNESRICGMAFPEWAAEKMGTMKMRDRVVGISPEATSCLFVFYGMIP